MDSYEKRMLEKKKRKYTKTARRSAIIMLVVTVIALAIIILRERVPSLQSKEGYRLQTCLLVEIQSSWGAKDPSYISVFQTDSGEQVSIPATTMDFKGRKVQLYVDRCLDAFRAEYELPRGPVVWYLYSILFLFCLAAQIPYWIGWLIFKHGQDYEQ